MASFKTAQILAKEERIKKVIFLVDRKDLDSQTMEEFNKFEQGSVDVTDNTSVLVDQMRKKDVHLIVTTIQKMSNAVKNPRYANVMDEYKGKKLYLSLMNVTEASLETCIWILYVTSKKHNSLDLQEHHDLK